jgi:hypothetical protein
MTAYGYPSYFVYYNYEHLHLALLVGDVFLYNITSIIYNEAEVRVFNSLNRCVQEVLALTHTINLIIHV